MGVHFHMPRIAAAAASFVLLARRAHVFFFLPDSDTGHDRTVSNAYLQ